MALIPSLPHTFVDGPGNTASGEEVMDNLNTIRNGINDTLGSEGAVFPSSPTDGQIFNYIAADGSVWTFRYRASSGLSTKWEFIGGAPLVGIQGIERVPSDPDLGPVVSIPRAGLYVVQYGHRTWHSTDADHWTQLELRQGGLAVTGDSAVYSRDDHANQHKSLGLTVSLTLAAGNLSLAFLSSDTQGRTSERWIHVTPRAV